MNWLTRLIGGERRAERAANADEPEDRLRAAYEREWRGDPAGADRLYRRVLDAEPTHADALYYLARLAAADRRGEEAIALLQQAVDLRPAEILYRLELGAALLDLRRFEEAAAVFERCTAMQPGCARLRNNYAVALIELNRRDEALPELERLQAELSNTHEIHFNLAGIYREFGRTDEAIAAYRRALALAPDHAPTYSNLLLELNYSSNEDAASIFAEHRRFGERFARRYEAPAADATWPRRLRIGYLSPDFHNHVVMRFVEPILAGHDRKRFEISCYHANSKKDEFTARLRTLAEHWVDAEDLSDAELAGRIRADRIDLLVDLAGHTAGNRVTMLAMKPAPVQATYLGYPNTIGLGAVDFRITDAFADPPGDADRFSIDRLVRLPNTYFCYRPEPASPEVGPPPALASGTVTFGCFNNFAKFSGPFLDAAARVLAEIPRSRLILKARPLSIAKLAQSVRERFDRAGIGADRVELRGWEAGVKNHLSIYNSVDIALDSFPYNGATTTCEALWMGVPVVSLAGDRHAGRAGSSLLHGVGLGHLVAHDVDRYVAICTELAGDIGALAELRKEQRKRMRSSPLMDESGFVRGLEACYLELWEKRARTEGVPWAAGEETAAGRLDRASRLRAAGRLAEARAICEAMLEQAPAHREALTLLWDLAFDAGSPGASVDRINKAIAAEPGVHAFHYMLGCALQALGRREDAIAAFRRAIALDATHAKTHNNLGAALEAGGNLVEAAECYRNAIGSDPRMAQALYNLGNVHAQLGDVEQAVRQIGEALAIEPRHADWRCNLGSLRHRAMRLDEAAADFRAAIEIDPGYTRAHGELGEVLLSLGRVEEARAALGRVVQLDPGLADGESRLLLAQHCWAGEDRRALFERHVAWHKRHAAGLPRATAHRRLGMPAGTRLNVGYVSPYFARHRLASHLEPVLAAHDRERVRVFCYSGAGEEDQVARRAFGDCEWRDLSRFRNEHAADQIRIDGIDILVDLAGHTDGGRLQLFGRKPAPVQATWLGYPNTTGLDTIDWRVTDSIADPEGESEAFYSEKLFRLPTGFLCYRPSPEAPDAGEAPQARAGHVTFGCFSDLSMVTSQMVALWAQVLLSLPGSRLVLGAHGLAAESARNELRERLLSHSVAGTRFDLRVPEPAEARSLAAYREIDIALDTSPFNGTTGTCTALWMGVPVLTLSGNAYVARTGASILARVGLSDLVAGTPEQYVANALRLAENLEGRRRLRAELRDKMRASSLMDATRFARALESAYVAMWEERRRVAA